MTSSPPEQVSLRFSSAEKVIKDIIYLDYDYKDIRSVCGVWACGDVVLTERCQTWTQTKFHLCSLCSHSSIIPSKLHLSDCPVFHPTTRKMYNNNNIAQNITAASTPTHLFFSYLILSSLKWPFIKVKNI